jgi:hypothetical protein
LNLSPKQKDKSCLLVVHLIPEEQEEEPVAAVVVLAAAVVPELAKLRRRVKARELPNIRRSKQTRLHLAALKR